MSQEYDKFMRDRMARQESSKKKIDQERSKFVEPTKSSWFQFGKKFKAAEKKSCDLVYKTLIQDLLKDHMQEKKMRTSLVVINSFDHQKDSIEEILEERRYYAEMLEIDRLNKEEREEYLLCFEDLY